MLNPAFDVLDPTRADVVVVCGAGAAGLAAALAAARCGAKVLLVERSSAIGGTVAHALIHTLGGLYDSLGEVINAGLPAELIERLQGADSRTRRRKLGRTWVLNVCPRVYHDVVSRWIAEEPRIRVLTGALAARVESAQRRIVRLEITTGERTWRLIPRSVIDATGAAEIARLLDPALLIDDRTRSAGGWIFRLNGVAPGALEFPKGLAVVRELRAAAAAGALPALCSHTWLDIGITEDEAFVKLMVPVDRAFLATAAQLAVMQFLRRLPDFSRAEVTQTGSLGVRDGGRIRGRYTLTADDVRQGRTFADAAGRCAWPIEYWDAVRGVAVEYLPPGVHYEIPLQSLTVADVDNFWVAGKCLSADRWAHASARVVGACWAMGQSVGQAAATGRCVSCAHQTTEHEWWAQPTLQP